WQFDLGSPQLPQRVEAVFRIAPTRDLEFKGDVQLVAPWLEGFEADHTLWTVYAPQGIPMIAPEAVGLVPAARQEFSRLESLKAVLDLTPQSAAEQSPDEVSRWYAPWRGRFIASVDRIRRLAIASNRPSAAREQDLDALINEETAIGRRLGAGSPPPGQAGP